MFGNNAIRKLFMLMLPMVGSSVPATDREIVLIVKAGFDIIDSMPTTTADERAVMMRRFMGAIPPLRRRDAMILIAELSHALGWVIADGQMDEAERLTRLVEPLRLAK